MIEAVGFVAGCVVSAFVLIVLVWVFKLDQLLDKLLDQLLDKLLQLQDKLESWFKEIMRELRK